MAILQQYSDLLLRGRVSVGYTYFTGLAKMDIAPGSASLAPLRVTPGTLLSSTVSGAIENDGDNLYWTDSDGVRSPLLSTVNYSQYGLSVLQASRLSTGRYIGIGGGVTAEASQFNGESDLILQVSSVNADYLVGSVPIDALPTGTTSSTVALGNHMHLYAGSASAGGPATTALACTGNSATATKLETTRALTIGNTAKNFDGSAAVSWTLAEIGAAATDHNHNYAGSSSAGGAATTALACTGNAATATKLSTARTISLTGSVTGSGSFDGSGDLSISTTTNHTHSYLPLSGGTLTGSLGVGGTASTSERLLVTGSSTYDAVLRLTNTGTSGADVFFIASNSAWSFGSNKLGIGFGTPLSTNVKVVVDGSNGYVGIGKTNPGSILDVNGTVTASSFSGVGSSITSLNASNLSSGTVPIARLPVGTASTEVAAGNHTHLYAGSSSAGGAASSATRLEILGTCSWGSIDNITGNGLYRYEDNSTSGRWYSYGSVFQFSNGSNPVPGTNDHWVTQILSSTGGTIGVRWRTNTGSWSSVQDIITSVGGTFTGALIGTSATLTGTLTAGTLNGSGLIASRAVVTDGSKNLVSSTVTSEQIGFLSAVTSSVQGQLDNKMPLTGAVIQNTNPFGGRRLYLNTLDNALYAADKKYWVTATLHLKEVGGVSYPKAINAGDITLPQWEDSPVASDFSSEAYKLFGNYYEESIRFGSNYYLKVRIDFNAAGTAYFSGYPYGTYYLSYYHTRTPDSANVRCYNNWALHTVGYKTISFENFIGTNAGQGFIQYADDNGNHERREIEFIIMGHPSHDTWLTQIEWRLQRPKYERDGAVVTKYNSNTLYHSLIFNSSHVNTITIDPVGTITAPTFIGALSGNASTATALANSRNFSISGGATASAVSFNGTGDVVLNVTSLNASNLSSGTVPIGRLPTGTTSTTVAFGDHTHSYSPTSHASSEETYGLATASLYGHAMASSATPLVAGTASVGTDNGKFAREDHVHPAQTSVSGSSASCTGNAATATKLATARTLTIGNTGKDFDGSQPVSWTLAEIGANQWQYGQYGTGSIKTNAATATGLRSGDEAKPYVYWGALAGQDLKAGGLAGTDQKWMLISPSTLATYAYGGVEYTYNNATANYVFLLLIDNANFIGSTTNPFNRCRIIANAGTNYLFNYSSITFVGTPITGNVYPVIVSTGNSTAPSGINYTESVSLYAPLKSSSGDYSGSYSVASGAYSVASGNASVASGYYSVASAIYSVASGCYSVASGNSSVASGQYSVASGGNSFASGYAAVASGGNSFASGYAAVASGSSQTVIGKYNIADTSSAFILGNGTSTSARSNCMTVDFSGNMTLAGALTLSNRAGDNRIAYFDSAGILQSNASYTLSSFASASHDHDTTYLKLSGGTLTGSLSSTGTFTSDSGIVINSLNDDRYLTFYHTESAGYSWRIGYLGSGAGEANYLTIESSQTSGTFTRAVQYGLISLDATHFGNILPATGVSKSLGSSTQKWSSVYASSFSGAYLVNNFGGTWIHGKTAEDCVLGNVQQSTSNYHVMMRVTSASGNVWNVGGINDTIGFYGYYAATTENRTDWATVWNTSTGALTHNKALTVSGATVLSSTLSVSSTVTFTSLSTAGVVHNSAAGVLSTGKVALGSEVSGILGVGNGGTGATTFTANGVLYGNGTGAVQATPAATVAGQFLVAGSDLKPVFSTVSVASGDHNHDATYLKLDGSSYMNGMLGYHVGNSYSFTNDGSYFEVLSIGPITGFVKIKASNPSTQANMIIRIDYYSYELKGYYVIAGLMNGPTKSWLSGSVLFKSNNLLPNVRLTYSVSQGHCVLLGNSSTVLNSQTNSSTPFIITVRHCHGAMFSAAPNWVITRESTEETWLYDQVYSTYNTGLSSDLLDGQHGSYYLNASNLNAGTVPFARLPTGTASDKVATGNHNHDTVYYRYVKNFTTNEDINTAGELGFYKNPGVTSVGIPTGASSYGTLLNLALPSYYGVQFYVTAGRIVYCRISNTVGGFSDWSTMWSSVNSNSTSYDWSAKNLTLAGTISGATTVTATTFSGSGASLTNLPAVSLTGQVSVANGGTGRASLTANYLLYGDGVNSVGMLAIGGANTFLKSTGSGYEWASIRKNDSSEITTLSTTKATPTAITYASGDNKVYHLQCMASSADQVFYVNLPDLANVVSGDKLEFTLTKTSGTYDAQVVFNPNTSSDIFRMGSSTTIAGTTERVRIGTGEAIVFYALYSGQAGLSWRVMRYVDMEV